MSMIGYQVLTPSSGLTNDERMRILSATVSMRMSANDRIVDAMQRTHRDDYNAAINLHKSAERIAGEVRHK